MQHKSLWSVAPLFLVLAIDSMGLGILFPILSSMIIDNSSPFLAVTVSPFTRELLYGMIIGIYMICWFIGAGMLGDFSDIVGRKKALMICLVGGCLGYFISAIAIIIHSVSLLIIGRIIAGFTAGSQPIAQAAIIDISPENHRARNIGYILLAVSIGFVIGPLAGGILSNTAWVSWFNFATPMWFAGIASLFNAAYLFWCFSETFTVTRHVKLRLHYAIQIFIEAFKHQRIRFLSVILLIFIAGWSEYFSFIAQFLLRYYNYSTLNTSLFITVLAVGFSIGFAVLVEPCTKWFGNKRCVVGGLGIGAALCLITATVPLQWLTWISAVFIGMSVAVAYSVLITIFSNQVDSTEQGWVMGVTSAIMALSFGVATFLSGFAADFGAAMPIIMAFIGMLISAILMSFTKTQ